MNYPDQKTKKTKHKKFRVNSLFPIFALISLINLLACSPIPERLKPAKSNDLSIFQQSNTFSEYINLSKQQITIARKATSFNVTEGIIQANTPFEYKPDSEECLMKTGRFKYKRGILLIHGLTASPYMMQNLGKFYSDHCFLVRAILLPGHGTRPGDLINVSYKDWIRAVNYGVESFNGQAENLLIAGYSIGGGLAVHHVLNQHYTNTHSVKNQKQEKNTTTIKGLFLFSPALKAKNKSAFLANTVSFFKDWISITEDRDFAAYESFPYNAAAQSYLLTQENESLLKTLTTFPVPVFLALSEDDETIDSDHTVDIFRRYMNTSPNRMQIYTMQPESYKNDKLIFALQSQISNEKIISFSHTSITVPRDHPHYGLNGNYRRCLHYQEHSTEWQDCVGMPEISQGEVNQTTLDHYTIRQLTYNPYYNEMLSAMEQFLGQIN